MRFRNSVVAVSAAAACLIGSASLTTVSSAVAGEASVSAACRSHAHSAKDSFNNGYPAKSSVPVRSRGPYGDCSIDGYIDSSTRLHYHCYTTNDHGNTWTWVRVVGGDIAGWVWDENLQGNGSAVRC